jgi:hypothetical protein
MAKKWMQGATHEEREGELRQYFGVKEGAKIPTEKLRATASRLHKLSEGGKKLSASQLRLSQQVNFALRARGD